MKRELLTDDELDQVTGGASVADKSLSAPAWLEDVKRDMNYSELAPLNKGSTFDKFKAIFQRMQLD